MSQIGKQDVEFEASELPVSVRVQVVRASGRQGVAGLDESELMDESELERWAEWQFFGPIQALPVTPNTSGRVPTYTDGTIEWASSPSRARSRVKQADTHPMQRALAALAAAGVPQPAAVLHVLLHSLRSGVLRLEHIRRPEVRRVIASAIEADRPPKASAWPPVAPLHGSNWRWNYDKGRLRRPVAADAAGGVCGRHGVFHRRAAAGTS